VSLRRLRPGELLAAAGAAALVVSLFLSWFTLQGRVADERAYAALDLPATGLTQLGWVVVATCLAAVALCVVMVLLTAAGATGQAIMATVLTVTFAAFAWGLVVLRIVLDQPDLGFDLPGSAVTIEPGGWLGLAGATALLAGAWWAMADERTDAPDSAYEPPPARPAPPAGASEA
jgi:hypothetical protein